MVGAARSIIPWCRNDKVRDGTAINSPSSTASAQAEEEEDGQRHKQESARLAQVRKQPTYQKASLNNRGAGDAISENLSQGAKKSGICAGKELSNKPFSDYLHLHSQKQQTKKVSKSLIKHRRRQRVCVMDSSYLHISLSDAQSDGRTKTRRRCTTYNILLPWSRIQLPLLTFGSRRTGNTKTIKIPSKHANIGALGLKAEIPSQLTKTHFFVLGTPFRDRRQREEGTTWKDENSKEIGSRSRSTQKSQYSQSCLEYFLDHNTNAQMRDYSRLETYSRFETCHYNQYSANNAFNFIYFEWAPLYYIRSRH
jgi:hypothetical protein